MKKHWRVSMQSTFKTTTQPCRNVCQESNTHTSAQDLQKRTKTKGKGQCCCQQPTTATAAPPPPKCEVSERQTRTQTKRQAPHKTAAVQKTINYISATLETMNHRRRRQPYMQFSISQWSQINDHYCICMLVLGSMRNTIKGFIKPKCTIVLAFPCTGEKINILFINRNTHIRKSDPTSSSSCGPVKLCKKL